jgi:hypothetical protein
MNNNLPSLQEVTELLDYNSETGEFTWKKKVSRRVFKGDTAGVVGLVGYRYIGINNKRLLAHRIAWLITTEQWPRFDIDHINGERADNRICNLREASRSENCHNAKFRKTTQTGFKGVYKNSTGRFYGRVCKNYKTHNTTCFDIAEEANQATQSLRILLHGDFVNHGEYATP